MQFRTFAKKLKQHVAGMTEGKTTLFRVNLTAEEVYDTYLDSFPPGTNELFRERRKHDCSACRHFIRDMGRVVAIENGKLTTIWDFDAQDETYQTVIDALSEKVKTAAIDGVFLPVTHKYGVEKSIDVNPDSPVTAWYHLNAELASSVKKHVSDEIGTINGRMNATYDVFKRSLEEVSLSAIETVLDLIGQKSLYKGEEWKTSLTEFKKLHKQYSELDTERAKSIWLWEISVRVGAGLGRIRNHSIGVLLTDITEGMELDKAVKRYEEIVAPHNYKRPKPIFTKKMVEQAQKTVEELGLVDALPRRYATLEDITVNNILFANRSAQKKMTGSVFDELVQELPDKPKNLSKVEEISIEDFINNVLPTTTEIEALVENDHSRNMVSLIAPVNKDSKTMFKWDNNFCWAYEGNITDSSMKENVKKAGGKVDGVLRFSIQWNDNDDNKDDLDAHCIEPCKNHIYFGEKINPATTGNLDVDIIHPNGIAVENITWSNRSRMRKGVYKFFVNNFAATSVASSGFKAEVEFDGKLFKFEYPKPLRSKQNVEVAEVKFDGQNFEIISKLESHEQTRDVWGVSTNKFHPVTVIMNSPNYWDGRGVGNKHYMFMLDKCTNPNTPNGFFNEFLKEEFDKHRKVFEMVGSKMKVQETENQLSGLGFSSTKRASLVVKVKGSFDRMLKIKF